MKTQLHTLHEQKIKIDNAYVAEIKKSHRLTQIIYTLENESAMAQTIAQEKKNI